MSTNNIASDALAERTTGEVITAVHPKYDEVRALWNGAYDCRPAVIVRCANTQDVVEAVRYARAAGVAPVVRAGGHSLAGLSTREDGIVIDLRDMKAVRIDTDSRRAFAQPGLLGGDLDRATQEHGLATTLGTVSHTGIAGLTLGGGMGWAMRKYGLASDNLRSVEAVLVDGTIVRASNDEHPDLFWALRGGGGRFAIVTEFEYELHAFGPQIALSQIAFLPSRGRQALRMARDLARDSAPERDLFLAYMPLPDDEHLPAELRGAYVYLVMGVSLDPADADGEWLAPLAELEPVLNVSRPCQYVELQSMFDEDNRHGVRAYSKGAYIETLSDAAIDNFADQAEQATGEVLIYLQQLGGAVAAGGTEDGPVQGRSAEFVLNVIRRWTDESLDVSAREFARAFAAAMAPHSMPTVPLNFDGDAPDLGPVPDAGTIYGPALDRLRAIKAQYDPTNWLGELRA